MSNNQLTSIIERVERMEAEIRDMQEDRKQIYTEAKGNGFDPKIIRKLVAVRRKKIEAVREEGELMRLYADQIGMQLFLPV